MCDWESGFRKKLLMFQGIVKQLCEKVLHLHFTLIRAAHYRSAPGTIQPCFKYIAKTIQSQASHRNLMIKFHDFSMRMYGVFHDAGKST